MKTTINKYLHTPRKFIFPNFQLGLGSIRDFDAVNAECIFIYMYLINQCLSYLRFM